ncbi:hypothetical protein [Limimaricola litoreus]|nr:hypothetical protein [Limimaricola litoreus]
MPFDTTKGLPDRRIGTPAASNLFPLYPLPFHARRSPDRGATA